jgi:hypothetical protein
LTIHFSADYIGKGRFALWWHKYILGGHTFYIAQYPEMRSPLKALHIITPAIGLFFQRTYSTPWGAYSRVAVGDQCSGYANTDTFSAGYRYPFNTWVR